MTKAGYNRTVKLKLNTAMDNREQSGKIANVKADHRDYRSLNDIGREPTKHYKEIGACWK